MIYIILRSAMTAEGGATLGPQDHQPEREVPVRVPVHRVGGRLRDRAPARAAHGRELALRRDRPDRPVQRLLHHDGLPLGGDRRVTGPTARPVSTRCRGPWSSSAAVRSACRTAWHLAERGVTDVTVIERGRVAGASSGLSVGIIETQYLDPLAIAGADREHALRSRRSNASGALEHRAQRVPAARRIATRTSRHSSAASRSSASSA